MRTRFISAVIMLGVLLPVVFVELEFPIIIVGLIAAVIAGYEYAKIAKVNKCLSVIFSAIGYYSILADIYTPFIAEILTPLYVVLSTFIITAIFTVIKNSDLKNVYSTLLSLIYIGFGIGSVVYLKTIDTKILIYLVILIALTDTFAYIIGKNFGKHKLSTISPNKTLEGSLGGTIVASVLAVIYLVYSGLLTEFSHIFYNIYIAIILTIIISTIGQIGDLFASKVKRTYGFKDFGNIFPGHGGILDRFDSLIFAAITLLIMFL